MEGQYIFGDADIVLKVDFAGGMMISVLSVATVANRTIGSDAPHIRSLQSMYDLKEYIHIHEEGEGHGGWLDRQIGENIRSLLDGEVSGEAFSRHIAIPAPGLEDVVNERIGIQDGHKGTSQYPRPGSGDVVNERIGI